MASYSISAILYTFPCDCTSFGTTKTDSSIGWGFPLHVEDPDGKIEGVSFAHAKNPALTPFRRMIGVLSLVSRCLSYVNGADVLIRDTRRSPSAMSFGRTAECVRFWSVGN